MSTFARFLFVDNQDLPMRVSRQVREVVSRDPATVALPLGAYGFYFFDRDGDMAPMRNQSMTYCYGDVSIDNGKRHLLLPGDNRILLESWHQVLGEYDQAPRVGAAPWANINRRNNDDEAETPNFSL